MQISQNYQSPSFNGDIIFKRNLEMAKAFKRNKTIIALSNAGYDVIGTVTRKMPSKHDYYHDKNIPLYRLLIKIRKENASKFEKLKYTLGLTPRAYLTRHHHSDFGNCSLIEERITPQFILKKFGIYLSENVAN